MTRHGKTKVLLIDDEEDFLNVTALRLKACAQLQLATEASGAAGLMRVAAFCPDVVLTDVRMQGMDGWALLERIRAVPRTAHIPVILMTAYISDALLERARVCGAADLIFKDFDHGRANATALPSAGRAVLEALRREPAKPGREMMGAGTLRFLLGALDGAFPL